MLSEYRRSLQGELASPAPDRQLRIPMRDGVALAADLYLPRAQSDPAPAIVQITPYGKSEPMWSIEARFYADHGYAAVVVDVRGTGESEGDTHWFAPDADDGFDVVEWVAAQPWCNGRIGTTGISYMGWTQWALASQHPPHLECMVTSAPAGRWMEEIPYTWGILQNYFYPWLHELQRSEPPFPSLDTFARLLRSGDSLAEIGERLGLAGRSWNDLFEHDTLDEFWRSLRLDEVHASITVPTLHVAGWYDLEDLIGSFYHYEGMMAHSPAASEQVLVAGPWSHAGVRYPHDTHDGIDNGPTAAVDMDELHLRWFDRWLRDDEARWTAPEVALFDTGRKEWFSGVPWRQAGEHRELFLDSSTADAGGLVAHAPEHTGEVSYRFDPADPTGPDMEFTDYPATDYPWHENAVEQRDDVVVWTSAPLEAEFLLSGWSELLLHAATTGTDTDWHVKLTDVAPDGTSLRVASGCLRASLRDGLDTPQPVEPGETLEYRVELTPAHHTFLPGHRLRVSVASADFPWFSYNRGRFGHPMTVGDPIPVRNTILTGAAHPSRIVLGTPSAPSQADTDV